MRRPRLELSSVFFAGFAILYPLLAVVAVHKIGAGAVVLILCAVLCARFLFPANRRLPLLLTLAPLPVAAAVAATAAFDRTLSVRLYPVFMNLAMLAVFASTLWIPPSMIERFARIWEPDLPESGVRYTHNVTIAWTLFFAVNASIALWTATQPGWQAWTIYNGGIAYLAAGFLFAGEYLIRQRVRRSSTP
jgi:uncharacterized membrane protein